MNAVTVEHEASIMERLMVSREAAEAFLSVRFSPSDELRMRELMEKSNKGTLSPPEQTEIDAFREVGSLLAILQAQARLRLQQTADNGHE